MSSQMYWAYFEDELPKLVGRRITRVEADPAQTVGDSDGMTIHFDSGPAFRLEATGGHDGEGTFGYRWEDE